MARLVKRLSVARLALFPLGLGLALVLVTGTLNRVMIVELKLPASLVGLFFAMMLIVAPARAWLGYLSDGYPLRGKRREPYIALGALLLAAAVIVFAALLVMKVVPSALEYNAIRGAITKVATAGGNSIRDYQVAFDRYAAIDDITSIAGKDLVIEKRGDGHTVISFEYEKRIPLFGPASLVIEYRGSAQ